MKKIKIVAATIVLYLITFPYQLIAQDTVKTQMDTMNIPDTASSGQTIPPGALSTSSYGYIPVMVIVVIVIIVLVILYYNKKQKKA